MQTPVKGTFGHNLVQKQDKIRDQRIALMRRDPRSHKGYLLLLEERTIQKQLASILMRSK